MQDFVEEIYNYAQLIPAVKEVIDDAYAYRSAKIFFDWKNIQPLFLEFCKNLAEKDTELSFKIFDKLKKACSYANAEDLNFNLFADCLEEMLTDMYQAISLYGTVDVNDGKFRIFSSKSGFFSIENVEHKKFYHSTVDPMREAYISAKSIFKPQYLSYKLLCEDLGYLAYQIYVMSDCSADVYVYYSSEQLAEYAVDYGVLSWIPEDKLNIVISPDELTTVESFFGNDYDENCCYHCSNIYYSMLGDTCQTLLRNYIIGENTGINSNVYSDINAYRNLHNIESTIVDYRSKRESDEWIVIAAGPSLDDLLQYIRDNEDKNIICVATAAGKLRKNGIIPDCICVLDPWSSTFKQFENILDWDVPLLVDPQTNWRIAEAYSGDKYIVPSISNYNSAKKFKDEGYKLIDPGSTVAIMAIRLAIMLKAEKIHLIGLDLAYPGGKTHAEGTARADTVSTERMKMVKSNNGGEVPTDKIFENYIVEVENLIKENTGVEFINHSTVGAYINGAKPEI